LIVGCSNLLRLDYATDADAVAALFEVDRATGDLRFLQRTEMRKNDASPVFETALFIDAGRYCVVHLCYILCCSLGSAIAFEILVLFSAIFARKFQDRYPSLHHITATSLSALARGRSNGNGNVNGSAPAGSNAHAFDAPMFLLKVYDGDARLLDLPAHSMPSEDKLIGSAAFALHDVVVAGGLGQRLVLPLGSDDNARAYELRAHSSGGYSHTNDVIF
jgi:hypothetical protein